MSVAPILPVGIAAADPTQMQAAAPVGQAGAFGRMLLDGVNQADRKIAEADQMVQAFALEDDSVPLHQVTFALEQARLTTELMMQVRSRLLEGYQEIMRMQL